MVQSSFDEFDAPQEKAKPRVKLTLAEFEEANPEIAAWWNGSTSDFAHSLRDFVHRNGKLSERQMAAAVSNVEKLKAALRDRQNAPTIDISHIVDSFKNAQSNGILRPKLRLLKGEDTFVFSRAPANGANPGSIYVTTGDDLYLGKILDGKFYKSRECGQIFERLVLEVCDKPEQAAVAYGQKFGACSCCGRTLTNALSIELGIGPICRSNFFG
jgi:hypothetical protein